MASTVWCLRQVIRKFNDALGDGVFDVDGEGMIQKYREFCAAREETDRYCLATDDFLSHWCVIDMSLISSPWQPKCVTPGALLRHGKVLGTRL